MPLDNNDNCVLPFCVVSEKHICLEKKNRGYYMSGNFI